MSATDASISFEASRIKLLPALLLILSLLLLYLSVLEQFYGVKVGVNFTAMMARSPLAVFPIVCAALVALYFIGLIIRPSILILTPEGWTHKGLFSSRTYRWNDFGEPHITFVAMGRGGQNGIRLPSAIGRKDQLIIAKEFKYDLHDMLVAVQSAKAGRIVDYGDPGLPKTYIFGWIPFSLLVLLAAAACWPLRLVQL